MRHLARWEPARLASVFTTSARKARGRRRRSSQEFWRGPKSGRFNRSPMQNGPQAERLWAFCLPQRLDASAEVDVVGLTVQHEGGHGFHTDLLGFGQARLALAEVNDFHIEAGAIDGCRDVLFSGNADRASSVIEDGFGFHGLMFLFVGS